MRILVCLDATTRAPSVLDAALDLARRANGKLLLLRIVGVPAHVDQEAIVHSAGTVIDDLVDKACQELTTLAGAIPSRFIEALDVQIGTAPETICREATRRDCDVVVLGSHHHSALSRLLGTTEADVLEHCDRAVVLARNRAA